VPVCVPGWKLGFTLSPEELNQAYTRFLSIADKKQEVFDEDLMAMAHEELQPASDHCQLEHLHVSGGTSSVPTATVGLTVNGDARQATSTGDGPIDALYKALAAITHSSVKLLKYEIRSVTSGTEALGEATVHLQQGEVKIVGRGASTDIIEASAKAYVDGLNKLACVSDATAWTHAPVQAVCRLATPSRPRLAISNSRILNLCTWPLRVIG
jgi:2-isopropylmalate synthase